MAKPQRWIGALWTWWAVCSLFLLLLWFLALTSRNASILSSRQLEMTGHARELTSAFSAMEKLQLALASSLALRIDSEALQAARRQADPFCTLYWVHPDGQPMMIDDARAPSWILSLAIPRVRSDRGLTLVRPLPPGMEAGRFPPGQGGIPADAPPSYLLACEKRIDGSLIISSLNISYIWDTWLPQRLQSFGLGPALTWRRIAPEALWADPGEDRILTFLSGDPYPLDALQLVLDNRQVLRENLHSHLAALAGGLLLMATFAFSIRLAAQGIRRELEFTQARSRFTAMVSHELRTPIAAIKMYSEILENSLIEDPAKLASYQSLIGSEAGRLERLVDSLLEVGALEGGKRIFRLQPENLNEVAREAVDTFLRNYPAALVEVQLCEAPVLINGDRSATLQVVENLLANALKYGAPPTTVRTRNFQLEIGDNGPGIPLEMRKRIFQPYERIASGKAGVGLGLAVVKGFMEGQGGRVEVGDQVGGGALFTLVFNPA